MDLNSITLTGRVATAPKLAHTSGGKSIAEFRLAVNRGPKRDAMFVTVKAWEKQAQFIMDYVSTGRIVSVQGQLDVRAVGEGEARRTYVDIVAAPMGVNLVGPAPQTDSAAAPSTAPARKVAASTGTLDWSGTFGN